MGIQSIFADDQSRRLAGYFEELYDYLLEHGVPEECLPSPWHVLRHVTRSIDHELLQEWLDAYVAVESEGDSEEDEETEDGIPVEETEVEAKPVRRRRLPPYLRALEPEADEIAEGSGDDTASPGDL